METKGERALQEGAGVGEQDRGALGEFYAPWCGHFKKLAPAYEKLGASFTEANSLLFAKVDCDEHKGVCGKYGEGERSVETLAEFVNNEGGTNVKTLVPTYEKVATTLNQEADVIANLDVDKYKVLAEKYGVSGYPTLEFFPKNNKAGEDYDANRDLDDKTGDGMIIPTHRELGIKYDIETLLEESVVGYADNFIQVKSLSNRIIEATKLMFTGLIESWCRSSIQSLFHYRHRPCTFDPGGEVSPNLMFATLFVVSWFPP